MGGESPTRITKNVIYNSNDKHGIKIEYSNDIILFLNEIYMSGVNGLSVEHKSYNIDVIKNHIHACGYEGILIDTESHNILVSLNTIYDCGRNISNPAFSGGNGVYVVASYDVNVSHNEVSFVNSGVAVKDSSYDVSIINNTLHECRHNGIFLSEVHVLCYFNDIYFNGNNSNFGAGLFIKRELKAGCLINRNEFSQNKNSLYIADAKIDRDIIEENNFYSTIDNHIFNTGIKRVFLEHNFWGWERGIKIDQLGGFFLTIWIWPYSDHPWNIIRA
jgi:hypothetical protein